MSPPLVAKSNVPPITLSATTPSVFSSLGFATVEMTAVMAQMKTNVMLVERRNTIVPAGSGLAPTSPIDAFLLTRFVTRRQIVRMEPMKVPDVAWSAVSSNYVPPKSVKKLHSVRFVSVRPASD